MTFKREIHWGCTLYRDEIEEIMLGCAGHLLIIGHGGWLKLIA